MTVRILCTGDIHIGRRSSRVTDMFRTADAWGAIVDAAIRRDVDLLAISGDVIDKENKAYEAIGTLQHGLVRLDEAGIETVAVTGNHDYDVLARVVTMSESSRFRLLGLGGKWERHTLLREGVPVLHVDGWSFPSEHVHDAPLRSYALPPTDLVPVLGLLHGEVGTALSRYAPIHSDELWAHRVRFWLLGHIHRPQRFEHYGEVRALYPGSPWAMDPGEPGVHGVWLAELNQDGTVALEQIPISPVRYESVEVDFAGVVDETGFQRAITAELNRMGRVALSEDSNNVLKTISARLTCVGQSDAHRSIPSWVERVRAEMSPFPVDSISIEIDQLVSRVQPRIDLEDIAHGMDPTAETAKLILALRQPNVSEPYARLVRDTLDDMVAVHEVAGYASLRTENDGPTEANARAILEVQAWNLLSTLLAQKGAEA